MSEKYNTFIKERKTLENLRQSAYYGERRREIAR